MRVLLLSAYAAASHRQWAQGLQAMFDDWQIDYLELPPRHFNWRARGNALYWSFEYRSLLESGHDLLLVTSVVDLATLRGLVPALARLPTAVFFHENQFAYPTQVGQQGVLENQVTSLYTALAANALWFNSAFNRDSFLAGCEALLRRLPDHVPPGVVDGLARRSTVLPVPLAADLEGSPAPRWPGSTGDYPDRPLRLQWLGRLEYDKGGDRLPAILECLEGLPLDYELAVTGQVFRQQPAAFDQVKDQFGHRLVQFGYLERRADYLAQLAAADIVLSTARHEFQGLAVQEAVSLGCYPVVPAVQVYPELYPPHCCYPPDIGPPGEAAVRCIEDGVRRIRSGERLDAASWQAAALAPDYRAACDMLLGAG